LVPDRDLTILFSKPDQEIAGQLRGQVRAPDLTTAAVRYPHGYGLFRHRGQVGQVLRKE